ncbi:aminoglycoside phosphotransferase family protein [Actinopolymorpha pittospori]|uniref:Streptomycin 6-kinase n=1 Tax=Actinopolymorpha pittospori TaxID=648752 RepID=A0A927MZ35_9ACTN|nr:aminoglycoside phosphotransferase family protein [Actinopolymorpha pittospori]MBE1609620.1 streptomycin 6-kinase [Actinopolymorpha pittospori]
MEIDIPDTFVEERTRIAGTQGHQWIAGIPALVERLCERWDLRLDSESPRHGANSLVLSARRRVDGAPCVLKVCQPPETTVTEAIGLRAWAGRGVVRLLDAWTDDGALLLERLDAGRSLADVELLPAAELAGALLRRLTMPAPPGIPRLADIGTEIAETVWPRQRALGGPLPGPWVDLAARTARDLAADAGESLVHADLHYGNVLAGTREPWLAIDPRPVAGDPEYSVPELMWTRIDEAAEPADVRDLLTALADAGGLDRDRARAWTVVRAVDYWLWGLGIGLTEDPVRCRRLVGTLAG